MSRTFPRSRGCEWGGIPSEACALVLAIGVELPWSPEPALGVRFDDIAILELDQFVADHRGPRDEATLRGQVNDAADDRPAHGIEDSARQGDAVRMRQMEDCGLAQTACGPRLAVLRPR